MRLATLAGAAAMSYTHAVFAEPAETFTVPPKAAPASLPGATARVHVSIDYESATIETRSSVDRGDWSTACRAPCDHSLVIEDTDLRVVAPRMTPSNEFRIEPGTGTARLRVSGGSSAARSFGIAGLLSGIPLTLGGGALFGYGEVRDRSGMRTVGIVTLAAGAAAVVAALPLLLVGSTRVRDARGRTIARAPTLHDAF
jgi:hypothetical protein